jgi:hypothetical protein
MRPFPESCDKARDEEKHGERRAAIEREAPRFHGKRHRSKLDESKDGRKTTPLDSNSTYRCIYPTKPSPAERPDSLKP